MNPLTPAQSRVLQAIVELTREKGYPPTVREICAYLGGRSTCTVHLHIKALVRKGALRHDKGKARSLVVAQEETGGEAG